ncbi:Y-family DNA polymerase [Ochrovirga pacifica]|uniref:Y-family DNA polymerase n=1 Tax=Ochrovirga pacifica TaxID=1042376 RepID=UPI0002F91138|nr:Y-family DNA polymerase [Ochrovirga pacifica]
MYALVDCNNFYASCERVFRPQLNGKPIAVLSNNDGCVIARSNEVKPYVPLGAPAFKFKEVFRQHNVHVFSSNYALYGDLSNRVMNVLRTFTLDVEIYSIDEAFLEFKGFEHYDLQSYGVTIRGTVLQHTGIPVSIGFAPTKALSKIANKIAKKFSDRTNGSYVIDSEEKRIKALKWTKIEDVWGIGRKFSQRLQARKVMTAYDFTQLHDQYVRKEFSIVGLRLKHELEGKSRLALEEVKNKKAIATTRSFDRDIEQYAVLKERVATFACSCAEKLRVQQSNCTTIMVFVLTNRYKDNQPQYSRNVNIQLPYPTSSSITISQYAQKALKAIYKEGYAYKKAGVIVMGIRPDNETQLNLFVNENPKHDALMKTIDKINNQLGVHKLKVGGQGLGRTWKMKQEKLSPRYTTHWDEVLEVE